RRGVPILFVLNRVPDRPGVAEKVVDHYAEMLAEAGFIPAPDRNALFVVYEQGIQTTNDGLPVAALAGLRKELETLADIELRNELVDRSSVRALEDFAQSGAALASVVRSEAESARRLITIADTAYARSVRELDLELREGRHSATRASSKSGKEQLAHAFTRRAGIGAQQTADEWSRDDAGKVVLDASDTSLWRHGPETDDYATEVVEGWVKQVQALAVERSKRGRISRRKRKKLTAALVDSATQHEGVELPKVFERFYGQNGVVAVARAVRELLTQAISDVARHDARRFREVVGDPSQLLAMAKALDDHGPHLVEDVAK
ncbi:MAG: hypothetical protein OEM22_01695, partial [Acidimicrobiia bacterium]|nr:hypothetical protein [Acidimicrobiia bacterium]